MATITRVFEFDSAHRVMNEKVKCFNLHGHRFKLEVTFFYEDKKSLGYAIDFKEIKRICGDFLDEHFDHACILNPKDTELIELCKKSNWRLWVMGLGSNEDINPSAENIASELFCIFKRFFSQSVHGVDLVNIRLYETPNCWVETSNVSYFPELTFLEPFINWRTEMGNINYDVRDNG